jgi:hypothetical protein
MPQPHTAEAMCKRQLAYTRAVARGEAGHSEEGRYPWS